MPNSDDVMPYPVGLVRIRQVKAEHSAFGFLVNLKTYTFANMNNKNNQVLLCVKVAEGENEFSARWLLVMNKNIQIEHVVL